jgi:hypothetical protein
MIARIGSSISLAAVLALLAVPMTVRKSFPVSRGLG